MTPTTASEATTTYTCIRFTRRIRKNETPEQAMQRDLDRGWSSFRHDELEGRTFRKRHTLLKALKKLAWEQCPGSEVWAEIKNDEDGLLYWAGCPDGSELAYDADRKAWVIRHSDELSCVQVDSECTDAEALNAAQENGWSNAQCFEQEAVLDYRFLHEDEEGLLYFIITLDEINQESI